MAEKTSDLSVKRRNNHGECDKKSMGYMVDITIIIFQGCPCSKCGRPLDPDDYNIVLDEENIGQGFDNSEWMSCKSCQKDDGDRVG